MRTDDSEVKYLKLKVSQDIFYSTFVQCFHYEKAISDLEQERSKLSVRATLAKTQFEKFQETYKILQ